MDQWLVHGDAGLRFDHFLMKGRDGVDCIESGGPTPGTGCAGRGITKAFELIDDLGGLTRHYDVALFDVLGDVVCGGFAAPMRLGQAVEVYIVTSGEARSLYAANNICWAVRQNERNGARLAGLIGNLSGISGEEALLASFASRIHARLLGNVPRDEAVPAAERSRAPVLVHAPTSPAAQALAALFGAIHAVDLTTPPPPAPMSRQAFRDSLRGGFAPG
jgi:nitrogenase iron protein NifH